MKIVVSCTVSLLVFFVGCSTLSQQECLQGDWTAIGLRDALAGKTSDRFQKHTEACAEYGIVPQRATYQKGYDQGLKEYCTPSNGFNVGSAGEYYYGICRGQEKEQSFMRFYDLGSRLHKSQQEMQSIERQIAQLEDEMLDPRKDENHRQSSRYEIRRLKERRTELQSELSRIQVQATVFKD